MPCHGRERRAGWCRRCPRPAPSPRIAPHVIPAMDRAVHRLTRGKVLLSAQMLPGVILTAPGREAGEPRRHPARLHAGGRRDELDPDRLQLRPPRAPGLDRRTCSPTRTRR